jgi:hypothetical protein
MASGRDFEREAEGGERDALIGIQTRGGTILRGTTVPPSPGGPAGREGIRRSPGTGRERSPPSPVRSSAAKTGPPCGERNELREVKWGPPIRDDRKKTGPRRSTQQRELRQHLRSSRMGRRWDFDRSGSATQGPRRSAPPARTWSASVRTPAWSLFVDRAKKDRTCQRRRTTPRCGTSVKLSLRAFGWRETTGTTPRGTGPRLRRRVWRAPRCTCGCRRWLRRKWRDTRATAGGPRSPGRGLKESQQASA